MDIIINKELQSLLPPLTSEEYRTLEESLLVDGCRDPLIVWNNILVDGHNRLEICAKHGINYSVEEIQAGSIEDIKIWIIDNQKGRRNLTDGWKFELAQVRKEILLKQGRENMSDGKKYGLSTIDKPLHNTQKEIAEELGWSTGKVAMADKVWKEAEPEVKDKIKSGELTFNQVYQDIKRDEKVKQRHAIIEETKRKIEAENLTVSGTYAADSRLIELRSGVSVEGAGRESTILVLTNTSENCCLKLDSWNGWGSTSYGNQHISGIKFDGDLTAASAIGVVGRSNVYVYDCEFIDFVNSAVFFSGQPSYTWTLQNIYSTKTSGDHSKMPDSNAWCSGNKAYNNIMTNCSRMADTEHHGGALRLGTQDGFEAYGNTINSLDRRGFGIKFYDLGWNKNTNIHDNDVEVSPILSGMRYDFAIELWWELGGCKVYNNRLKGSLDLVHSVDHINAGYSMQIYGNNVGRSDAIPTTNDRGIVLEGRIEYVEVYRNYIHNVTRAFYIPRELNGGLSGVDRIYYTKIYDNLCVNLGWEQASRMWGIYFLPQDQTVNQDETQYFYVQNNTWTIHPDITVNTWCGLMLPNVSQMSNVYYDNNIIVGFDRGGIVAEYARTKADNIFIRKNLIYDCGNNNQPYYDAAFNSSLTNYTFVAGPTTSPQFVSSTDFHLQSSSPAIGQGVNVGLLTDYDGNTWKNIPCIGCYEYGSSTPPDTQDEEVSSGVVYDSKWVVIDGRIVILTYEKN